jgi:hypothetical protein
MLYPLAQELLGQAEEKAREIQKLIEEAEVEADQPFSRQMIAATNLAGSLRHELRRSQ